MKPCPFCGSVLIKVQYGYGGTSAHTQMYAVICRKCGSMGSWCVNKSDAVERWERRIDGQPENAKLGIDTDAYRAAIARAEAAEKAADIANESARMAQDRVQRLVDARPLQESRKCFSCGHFIGSVGGCDLAMPKCDGQDHWVSRDVSAEGKA
jgi:Lar family restriction alleviation protein